jgi:uncharacterized protein (DUF4415 family)
MRKEGNIVRYTSEELDAKIAAGEDRTDWDRVRSMTDAEIEANVDEVDEGTFDYSTVYVGIPGLKSQLLVQYDQDIVDWFLGQGSDYPRLMNQALREYILRRTAKATAAD